MRLFWELFKRSFQRQLTYRTAVIAGLLTNLFFGFLRAAVLQALYGPRPEVAGISLQGAVTFTGLSQGVIGFLSMFNWFLVMNSIYTGDIASDLLKPASYFSFWMAQDAGRAVVDLVLRGLPIMLAYALIFHITLPTSAGQWLAFALALALAWFVSFAWRFLVNLAAFWTPGAFGIGRLAFIFSWFFSGFLMPLRFFPDWFVKLCYLTPFPTTVNTVVEIYLGVARGPDLLRALAGQLLWGGILLLAGQVVLRAGVRRLVIQGG